MAVTTDDGELMMQDPLSQESGIVTGTGEEVDEVEEETIEMQELKIETVTSNAPKSSQNSQSDPKLQKEMETCFGFDEVSVSRLAYLHKLSSSVRCIIQYNTLNLFPVGGRGGGRRREWR